MQLANKYNPLLTIILAIVFSQSLLCINHCVAGDVISDVCSSTFSKTSTNALCYQMLRSKNNTCKLNDLGCMGSFVNTQAINATQYLKKVAINATANAASAHGGKGKNPAQDCVKLSTSAIGELIQCKGYWNITGAWNKSNLLTHGSAAETNVNTCDNGFVDKKEAEPAKLADASGQAQAIISVMLAFANKLK